MFNPPKPNQNFFELEQQILNWWKQNKVLEKSIEQRPADKVYTFYDGPITANGTPHHGHMLTFAMKDIIPRYWTMKGFKVARSLGWDCQGIPVEYEIEKKLGFKEKKDIEKFGIAKFNKLCRDSVIEHRKTIIELEELMGRLTNEEETYSTMDPNYIESIWWSIKELYKKGLLYEGFKVVPYSTRAGTTLSNAEVALGGYKPFVDPAITVEFVLSEMDSVRIIAWTTTPWTIPSNLGLAINTKIKYVKVLDKSAKKKYVLAKDRVKEVFKNKEFEILEDIDPTKLVGMSYEPPFEYFKGHKNAHRIFEGNSFVTTETGTGIVHLAPYGAEDNELFIKQKIQSFDVLDDQGDFTDKIFEYKGKNYRDANPLIIEDLKNKDRLFSHENYEHEMPMCWRTNTPLIYKPITSWYVAVSNLRDKLVDLNNKINWIPAHVKEGRFGNWLAEIKDWGISRLRYWGTPLPIWKSESGKVMIIESFSELEKLSGKTLKDPHRPFVDEIEFDFEGEHYKRIPDVLDVWYDSGAMPFARFHYPFENKDKFESKFPAQYIAESVDQTRGWFYTLHALGTTLFESNAFENVVMSGFVLDDHGVKLSKSKKNYTEPTPMIQNFGADTIRLNFFSTPISAGEDTTISDKTLRLQKQETILPLWNIFSYLVMYANANNWKPREELAYNLRSNFKDSHPWDHIPFDDIDEELDAWIILKLQQTIKSVHENLDSYKIPKATEALKNLISEISKWYIRNSRQRFASKDTAAIEVLYYVLVETAKLLAPFTPFIAEAIYKELVANHIPGIPESVHLTDYPKADNSFIQSYEILGEEMEVIRKVVEIGHNLRTNNKLKVRQPLSKVLVKTSNKHIPEFHDWMKSLIVSELNVKNLENVLEVEETKDIKTQIDEVAGLVVGLDTKLDQALIEEGKIRELTRQLQSLRKKSGLKIQDKIAIAIVEVDSLTQKTIVDNLAQIKKLVSAESIEFNNEVEAQYKLNLDGKALGISLRKI